MSPDPLALLEAETARADADFFHAEAVAAFSEGDVEMGLYFLNASDHWAPPTQAQVSERIAILAAAMKAVSGQRDPVSDG